MKMDNVKLSATSGMDIDLNTLNNLVSNHYKNDLVKFNYLYGLYKGRHEIEDKVVTDPLKPNNKISNDFYGQVIDTQVGYFLGKPIVVNAKDDLINKTLDEILEKNFADDLFLEVGKEMMIKGRSSVMVYQDESGNTRLTRIPSEDVIFVFDKGQPNEVMYAIRVYDRHMVKPLDKNTVTPQPVNDGSINSQIAYTVRYAEVYSATDVTYYKEVRTTTPGTNAWVSNGFELDTDRQINPMPHIFKGVPIIPFRNNEEEQSDFEKIISLVNDYDKIVSLSADEHEAYRNAYLMIKNMVMSADTLQRLKEEGVIEVMEDGDVKFITKDIPKDAIEAHLDRVEKNIHKFSQVPDLTDENFASNLSGVAIRFKLFGLENKCIIKERKMQKAIKQLLSLLAEPIRIITNTEMDIGDVDVTFTRNVPDNITEIVNTVTNLNGVVDKETLLSLLPFVDNPKDIIEKLEAEQDQSVNMFKRNMFVGAGGNTIDDSMKGETPTIGGTGLSIEENEDMVGGE